METAKLIVGWIVGITLVVAAISGIVSCDNRRDAEPECYQQFRATYKAHPHVQQELKSLMKQTGRLNVGQCFKVQTIEDRAHNDSELLKTLEIMK